MFDERDYMNRETDPEQQPTEQPAEPMMNSEPTQPTEQPAVEPSAEAEFPRFEQPSTEPAPSIEPAQPQHEQPQQPVYAEQVPPSYQPQEQPQPMFDRNSFGQGPQWNNNAPQYGWQPQPNYQPMPAPKKKMGKGLKRFIAAMVAVAVLGGGFGVFSIFYSIEPGSNGTLFSVERRGSHDDRMEIPSPTADPNGGYDLYVSPTPEVSPSEPLKGEGVGEGGPEMKLDHGDSNGALTPQQVAAKCKQWTVGVVATKYYDSYYYFSGATSTSTGTGIIMSSDGYIITNHHVIENATALSIIMLDGAEYEAKLIGSDEKSDLAVLKIDASGLPAAEFGDSDALLVGDPVYAIGNPLGLELMGTFTDGIVSAINRDVTVDERTMTLIQTNAAINSGNSGGPLINQYGQVVGINTLKMQDYSTTVEGLGFAIPTNTAKAIIDELVESGYVSGYPAIGLRCDNVNEAMSKYYKIPTGVLVRYVNPNANAYFAGLQVNDVIVEAQGERIENYNDLSALVQKCKAGDSFTLKVYHYNSGEYEDLQFALNDENDFQDSTAINPSTQG